jgi:hypothetical protein
MIAGEGRGPKCMIAAGRGRPAAEIMHFGPAANGPNPSPA